MAYTDHQNDRACARCGHPRSSHPDEAGFLCYDCLADPRILITESCDFYAEAPRDTAKA